MCGGVYVQYILHGNDSQFPFQIKHNSSCPLRNYRSFSFPVTFFKLSNFSSSLICRHTALEEFSIAIDALKLRHSVEISTLCKFSSWELDLLPESVCLSCLSEFPSFHPFSMAYVVCRVYFILGMRPRECARQKTDVLLFPAACSCSLLGKGKKG